MEAKATCVRARVLATQPLTLREQNTCVMERNAHCAVRLAGRRQRSAAPAMKEAHGTRHAVHIARAPPPDVSRRLQAGRAAGTARCRRLPTFPRRPAAAAARAQRTRYAVHLCTELRRSSPQETSKRLRADCTVITARKHAAPWLRGAPQPKQRRHRAQGTQRTFLNVLRCLQSQGVQAAAS